VWQGAYPLKIYVCILEISLVKQSGHGFFCAYEYAPTTSTAFTVKCLAQKILEKICHFPELKISQK
jgi:hypothetical protein